MNYLEQFNDTFVELVEDLIRVFPSDSDFRMYKLAIQGASIADNKLIQSVFHERVATIYGDRIIARDEAFFIQNDYSDMKQEFSQAEQLIQKLKTCWTMLTTEQKEVVWKYMRVLILLDRKITSSS